MRIRLLPATLICAGSLGLLAAVLPAVTGGDVWADGAQPPGSAADPGPAPERGSLSEAIQRAQQRLRRVPDDDRTWAQLGAAYVQQARIAADSSYYPKAEQALKRSLQLKPEGNAGAMLAMGALANARHEFARARDWARRSQAVNPHDAGVYGVLADALTQLGDHRAAEVAIQKMLDLQPGVAAFARASYAFEQRGRLEQARASMNRALDESGTPADLAFCRYHLGELEFDNGDPDAALKHYAKGLIAEPGSDQLLAGRAKAEAALGRSAEALRDYATAVDRVPRPEHVLEYAELLDSLGRHAEARAQYRALTAIRWLAEANGVSDQLEAAVIEADHGSAAEAVRHARTEWGRRHSVLVADALAWALHRAGADREALRYATAANRLGWHNATFAYHLGMIELSLGKPAAARRDLGRALRINPKFSVLHAPAAVAALRSLGGSR